MLRKMMILTIFAAKYASADSLYKCIDENQHVSYSEQKCAIGFQCSKWNGSSWTPNDDCILLENSSGISKSLVKGTERPRNADMAKTIRSNAVACKRRESFERMAKLKSEGDMEAMKKYLFLAVAADECKSIPQGSMVYVEDTSLFSGLVKVREAGELEGFWVLNQSVDDGK